MSPYIESKSTTLVPTPLSASTMSTTTITSQEEFRMKICEIKLLRTQINRFTGEPEENDPQHAHYTALCNDLKAAEQAVIEYNLANPTVDVKPQVVHAPANEDAFREASLMTSYITSLKFSGRSEEDCSNLLTKVKAIQKACPSTSFISIWNSIQPCLPASIIRTLAGKSITKIEELKHAITTTYGSHSNIFQRLEEFFSKRKSYKTPFTQYQSELEGSLTSIATVHKEWLRRRASLSRNGEGEQNAFSPSYDDCIELINFLKLLTEVRSQDESLFRAISIELTSITSPAQLATRAEQIRQQVHSSSGFNAAHRGSPRDSPRNSRPGSSDRRKKNNKNADKGDKNDRNANNSKKRGDNDKKSNGSRKGHVGSKPSKNQQQYGAHYSSCNPNSPSDDEDGAYQLRDDNYPEDEYFSDASEASACSVATTKN